MFAPALDRYDCTLISVWTSTAGGALNVVHLLLVQSIAGSPRCLAYQDRARCSCDRCCGVGDWRRPNRSRPPPATCVESCHRLPDPTTACHAISRGHGHRYNESILMRSPFQQPISKPSEHQRRFERMTMNLPARMRPVAPPASLAGRMLFWRMIRKTRL